MAVLLILFFFKSVCLSIQNIVLNCYDRFLNPRYDPQQNQREFLIKQIRIRKRAAKRRTNWNFQILSFNNPKFVDSDNKNCKAFD